MYLPKPFIFLLFAFSILPGCSQQQKGTDSRDHSQKITFDLGQFNEEGLYGPPDGLRSMDYEFCIPADISLVEEVRQIDSTLAILEQATGRIGCSEQEYLCIGTTHQANFRSVLHKLASLDYITRIDPCYYE